jgi:hypothetical protein
MFLAIQPLPLVPVAVGLKQTALATTFPTLKGALIVILLRDVLLSLASFEHFDFIPLANVQFTTIMPNDFVAFETSKIKHNAILIFLHDQSLQLALSQPQTHLCVHSLQ